MTRSSVSQHAQPISTGDDPLRVWLWRTLGCRLFTVTFHNWYGTRRWILTAFGCQIAKSARVRPTARISRPWNLTIGEQSSIGDKAVIDSTAHVTLGRRCSISQYAHVATSTQDPTKPGCPRVIAPITLKDDSWLATDVYVAPGVTIGPDTVVGARSSVFSDLPPATICAGDNARPLGPRVCKQPTAPSPRFSGQ